MLKEGGAAPETRIAWAWREATGRVANATEVQVLCGLLDRQSISFTKDASGPAEVLPPKADPEGVSHRVTEHGCGHSYGRPGSHRHTRHRGLA